ncbi:hypothetical protein Tco_0245833 [Tanacetum coccineum]
MVDYSLWEVIENGNAPLIKKLVEGLETIIAPSTAEEKAQSRLELKARSTLLMGIPNEHQLKFNSIKDAKSLLSEVLDQTFDRLQKLISQLEIHGESISQEDVNKKFLRKEMDLRWQMVMLTMRARIFLKNTGRNLTVNGTETIRFDKSKSDQAEEGPTNFALMDYSSTSSNSEVSTDSNCSSSCLKNVKILKEQNEQLLKDLRIPKINAITYKTEEFVNEPIVSEPTFKKPVVETSEAKASTDKPKVVRMNNGAPIIEDLMSDSE